MLQLEIDKVGYRRDSPLHSMNDHTVVLIERNDTKLLEENELIVNETFTIELCL